MPKISALPVYSGSLPPTATGAFNVAGVTYQAALSDAAPSSGVFVTPETFGAIGDGVTDDTQAILDAIDYFVNGQDRKQQGGTIFLGRQYAISETIEIDRLGVNLLGSGWANTTRSRSASCLKWIGAAGAPMVLFKDTVGAGVQNLRLIGDSSARPSAAIEFRDTGADLLFCNNLSRVWIGLNSGYDADTGNQFDTGILASGSQNGDSNLFDHIRISGCENIGIDIQNGNFSITHFNSLYIQSCPISFKINRASAIITNFLATNASDSVFVLDVAGFIQVNEMASESSHRMLRCEDGTATTKLLVRGGSFQMHASDIASDGRIIDTGNTDVSLIDLQGFHIQYAADYDGPQPKIRAYKVGGTSSHSLRLCGVRGIGANNLELGTLEGPYDTRDVIFEPAIDRATLLFPRQQMSFDYNVAEDRSWQSWRNDFPGKLNVFGGPLNVRKLAPPTTPTATAISGSGATTYSYRITALTWDGETQPTSAATCTNAATLDASHVNRVQWVAVLGARAYRVYGRSSGTEQLLATVAYDDLFLQVDGKPSGPYWEDDGSVSPSGALPTINGTGNAVVDGRLKVGVFTVANLPTGTAGDVAFASNGRKNGEGAASGTGVLVFHDGTAWRACDTGATVAA